MRKLNLLCIFLIIVSVNLLAQGDKKIDELNSLYIGEEYGKVVSKGLKLMGDDKYRNHPEAYLYTSKAYHQMFLNPSKHNAGTKDSDHPTPLKNAQKYFAKFNKVELKSEKYFPNYEKDNEELREFSKGLIKATHRKGLEYYIGNKASKAAGVYKNGVKAIPNEPVLILWQGVTEVAMKNTVEGDKNINKALEAIDESFTPSNASKNVLTKGLLLAEEYLRGKSLTQKANKAKTLAEKFKKDDTYDKIKDEIENPETPADAPADPKIDKLLFLFVDEKFEDVTFKAHGLMESQTYSKHPAPYLYTAMAYYQMSRRPGQYDVGEKDSKYPKPLKDAQKYLAKYNKVKTKSKKYFPYYNADKDEVNEFYKAIADTTNQIGQYLFLNEEYRKAAGFYKNGVIAVPNDPVLLLWQGISEIKSKNTSEGSKNTLAALNKIDENFEPSIATRNVLAHGLLLAEEYFKSNGNRESANKAKKLVEVFKKYDPDELDKQKMAKRKNEAKTDDRIMKKFYSDENDEDNKGKGTNLIIKDGAGSNGNGSKSDEDELDRLEKEAADGGGG